MSDRVNALTVILEHDLRDEDLEPVINAILHIKGVLKVRTHVADLMTEIAEARAKRAIQKPHPRSVRRKAAVTSTPTRVGAP